MCYLGVFDGGGENVRICGCEDLRMWKFVDVGNWRLGGESRGEVENVRLVGLGFVVRRFLQRMEGVIRGKKYLKIKRILQKGRTFAA